MRLFLKNLLPAVLTYLFIGLPLFWYMKDGVLTGEDWYFFACSGVSNIIIIDLMFGYVARQIKKRRDAETVHVRKPH